MRIQPYYLLGQGLYVPYKASEQHHRLPRRLTAIEPLLAGVEASQWQGIPCCANPWPTRVTLTELVSRISTDFHMLRTHIRLCLDIITLNLWPRLTLQAGPIIRVYVLILATFLPTVLMAEMSDVGRNNLINIFKKAQRSSDLGTMANIANELQNVKRPTDFMLGKR